MIDYRAIRQPPVQNIPSPPNYQNQAKPPGQKCAEPGVLQVPFDPANPQVR